jgi:hypothetical protein
MKHICRFCNKEFDSGPLLGSHVRSHTRKLIVCETCNQSFGEKAIEKHRSVCARKKLESQKICEKCGIRFESTHARFCSRSCANSHIVTDEHKIKTSNTLSGRRYSDKPKKVINEEIRQKRLAEYLERRKARPCKYCGKDVCSINGAATKDHCIPRCSSASEYIKNELSKALKGRTGGYREKGGRGKGDHYNGIWMDSTWEIEAAKRLDALKIRWERDTGKHRFRYVDAKGNNRHYFPDFYLPDYNTYLEIKGYWTNETHHKMNSVKQLNQIKLIVLDSVKEIQEFTSDKLI